MHAQGKPPPSQSSGVCDEQAQAAKISEIRITTAA